MSGQLGQGRGEMLPGVVRTAVDDAELGEMRTTRRSAAS